MNMVNNNINSNNISSYKSLNLISNKLAEIHLNLKQRCRSMNKEHQIESHCFNKQITQV